MRFGCEDSIEIYIEDTLCENVHLIWLAYNMFQYGAVVSTVMNFGSVKGKEYPR
jgi:hypothetical protein